MLFCVAGARRGAAVVARARAARGGARRVLRAAAASPCSAWSCSRARRTSSRCSSASSCCRSRSTCCARPRCGASTSLESGLKYLIIGSVGSATLVYGLALLYGATGSTDFAGIAEAAGERPRAATCCSSPARADRRRPRLQGVGRAVPPVDARRLRGRADAGHRVHGGGDEGGGVRRAAAPLRRRADRRGGRRGRRRSRRSRRSTIVVGNVGALGQSSLKRLLA